MEGSHLNANLNIMYGIGISFIPLIAVVLLIKMTDISSYAPTECENGCASMVSFQAMKYPL